MKRKTKHIEKYIDEQLHLAEVAFMERIKMDDITDEEFADAKRIYQNALLALGFVKFHVYRKDPHTRRVSFVAEVSLQRTEGAKNAKKLVMIDPLAEFLEKKFEQIEKAETERVIISTQV